MIILILGGEPMKATGIVRKVDNLGRIVLPIELRKKLDIEIKDPLEIFVEDDLVMLRKYAPHCVLCGSIGSLKIYRGKNICTRCIAEI